MNDGGRVSVLPYVYCLKFSYINFAISRVSMTGARVIYEVDMMAYPVATCVGYHAIGA